MYIGMQCSPGQYMNYNGQFPLILRKVELKSFDVVGNSAQNMPSHYYASRKSWENTGTTYYVCV